MKRAAVVVLASVGLVLSLLAVGSPAHADTVSVPFQGSKLLKKKCKNPGAYRVVKTVQRAPRLSDSPAWRRVDTTQSATGEFKTEIFVKNSWRDYTVAIVCNSEHKKYRITTPVTYLHKVHKVNYNCFGAGCRLLGTSTSDWAKGYCMRGENGMVCTHT